jgi:hypothetical protein
MTDIVTVVYLVCYKGSLTVFNQNLTRIESNFDKYYDICKCYTLKFILDGKPVVYENRLLVKIDTDKYCTTGVVDLDTAIRLRKITCVLLKATRCISDN